MGIEPTYPSEKYGYVIPQDKEEISKVETFKEKPDIKTAEEYIKNGALWNGGVFAYKVGYVLKRAHELIDFTDYDDLFSRYDTLRKISFDYAVVEHEKDIAVLRFAGCRLGAFAGGVAGKRIFDPVVAGAAAFFRKVIM